MVYLIVCRSQLFMKGKNNNRVVYNKRPIDDVFIDGFINMHLPS